MDPDREDLELVEGLLREFVENGGIGRRYFMGDEYREAARLTLAKLDKRREERARVTDMRRVL